MLPRKSRGDAAPLETPKKGANSVRSVLILVIAVLLGCFRVYGGQERTPDIRELAKLEARAARAEPKDQCLLYAKLVHATIDLLASQIQASNEDEASIALRSVQSYAARIDPSRANAVKKLKNAEILLGRAAFKLRQLLMDAPLEDRPILEKALNRVSQVQTTVLLQVFEH